MAESERIPWAFPCFGASSWKRTDRANVPHRQFSELIGVDGSTENGCRPMSGLRFLQELAGNPHAAATSPRLADEPTPVQIRVSDSALVDGFVYRVTGSDGNNSRLFFKWRKVGAVSYQADTVIGPDPWPAGAGLQPMSVLQAGNYCYIFIKGQEPLLLYFRGTAFGGAGDGDPADLRTLTDTGPGKPIFVQQLSPVVASTNTASADNYVYSGTNGGGNLTDPPGGPYVNPGDHILKQVEPTGGAPANVKVFSFSFFDTATVPANVTNPLVGPSAIGTYLVNPNYPTDPTFERFVRQEKLEGSTLTNVPDLAKDSRWVNQMGPIDTHRRYGVMVQLVDTRTGRISRPSRVLEVNPLGMGTEPYRSPVYTLQTITGTAAGVNTSSLYRIANGFKCAFLGLEIVVDGDKWNTLHVYRTAAGQPRGALFLDSIFSLGGFITSNQRKSAGVNLSSPYQRCFVFLRTPESEIIQQSSFDSGMFLTDEDMPKGGAAIMSEGTAYVGNIGSADTESGGLGVIRWSVLFRQSIESFNPLAKYSLRSSGEEILRFVHVGPNLLGFSRQNTYWIRRDSTGVRVDHVSGGKGITNPRAACEVGASVFFMSPDGLYKITQNGQIDAVRNLDHLLINEWRGTLDQCQLGYDQEANVIVVHNVSKKETVLLWLKTSRITILHDTVFTYVKDGPTPENAATANRIQQRVCFFQEVEPTPGTFRWRVFVLDHIHNKTNSFAGHSDDGKPLLRTLHPWGTQAVQVVHTSFTSGTTLKVKAAGMHTASTVRLEGCRIYAADPSSGGLLAKKATIKRFTLNTDAGASHTLELDSADASNLHGLLANESIFLSPVYFRVVAWPVGTLEEELNPGMSRNFVRQRLVSTLQPSFIDVSGPPTLTVPGTLTGNGYSTLARFIGLLYEGNSTTPAVRVYPVETDGDGRRSLVDDAAVIPAKMGENGTSGTLLTPGIEVIAADMDFQLLEFRVDGKIRNATRSDRAVTGA